LISGMNRSGMPGFHLIRFLFRLPQPVCQTPVARRGTVPNIAGYAERARST
jgi:hypothetical protein